MKRIPRKDLVKLKRLAQEAEKAVRSHRDWIEQKCDELGCYHDEWIRRAGYIRRGAEFVQDVYVGEREKADPELTKEARRREDEALRIQIRVDTFAEKLADRHDIYASDIDLKTGEIKENGAEILPEMEEEAKALEESK